MFDISPSVSFRVHLVLTIYFISFLCRRLQFYVLDHDRMWQISFTLLRFCVFSHFFLHVKLRISGPWKSVRKERFKHETRMDCWAELITACTCDNAGIMPNTHRRCRRDATVELSHVGVGGVNTIRN